MPTSLYETIGPMLEFIRRVRPQTVLDVGSGCGKFGLLIKEYVDVWDERIKKEEWTTQVDAVEIWKPYLEYPVYQGYYRNLYNMDIVEFSKTMPQYDLAICGDVIEHIEKEQGWDVLHRLLDNCKYILLSLPLGSWPFRNYGENKYEDHISTWDVEDLHQLPIEECQYVIWPKRRDAEIAVALIKGNL